MRKRSVTAALGGIILLSCAQGSGPPDPQPPQTWSGTIQSGGRSREYEVYVPASAQTGLPAPAVIVLHGAGGTGAGMRASLPFDDWAERFGFVVLYPSAAAEARRAWALGCPGCTWGDLAGVDDIAFVVELIDSVALRAPIDRAGVYVAGHSLGGSLAALLACRRAEVFAGAAVVASLLTRGEEDACSPSRPVSFIQMLGTEDPNVPLGGGGRYDYLGARETVARWANRSDCRPGPVEIVGAHLIRVTYSGCALGHQVRLYEFVGAGHAWPGTPIEATEEIMKVFAEVPTE